MIIQDILPILILLGIAFTALAIALILKIRSKKSLILDKKNDFIDDLIDSKKRKLNANISGMTWNTYTKLLLVCPLGLGVLGYIFSNNKAFCIVFAFVGLFIPEIASRVVANKQKKNFEMKYAMALRSLASGLRSGLSLEQSIDNVGKNAFLDEAIRNGFRQIGTDIKLGIPIDEAFRNFAIESGSKDAHDVAAVISMQSKVGGSEAAVITNIVQNINGRILVRNEIKALFADTDILILVMDFVPFVLFGILYFAAPQLVEPFFATPLMTMALIGIFVITIVGSIIIRKISRSAKEG